MTETQLPPRLKGIQIKLQRAYDHLIDLEKRVAHFVYHRRYEILSELNADSTELSARINFLQKPAVEAWGGIVGDFVHNLRSALEHVAWQVVDANGGAVGRDVKFPIYQRESDYVAWRTADPKRRKRDPFAGVDPRAIDAVEAEQPYAREDGDPADHPLSLLNAMWNRDKHQILTPVVLNFPAPYEFFVHGGAMVRTFIGFGIRDFEPEPEAEPNESEAFRVTGRLDDGQHLVTYAGRVTGPNPEIYVQGDLTPEVCLDEERILTDILLTLHRAVTETAERLAVFLV